VVDDDADARGMMRMLLIGHGASVSTAASCDEALVEMAQQRPDVLMSDIGMPGRDGYDLIRQMRTSAVPGMSTIPAVAITGLARSQDRLSLLRAGFQAHLCKPVDPEEAVALVAALAGQHDGRAV
jgi:CheY-like chemotaxis protein